eukprot:15175547-Heterocapsa_arctica.AAC.1
MSRITSSMKSASRVDLADSAVVDDIPLLGPYSRGVGVRQHFHRQLALVPIQPAHCPAHADHAVHQHVTHR